MAKQRRYGPRFSGGGVEDTRNLGYLSWVKQVAPPWTLNKTNWRPSIGQKIRGAQANSLTNHRKKGICPSMPRFSFDEPKPMTTPTAQNINAKIAASYKLKIIYAAVAKHLPGGIVEGVVLEQGGATFISVKQKNRRHTLVFETKTGKFLWSENG